MKVLYVFGIFAFLGFLFHVADAAVYVPNEQYGGYFDSQNVYTVYGWVGNNESQPLIAKVIVTVDGITKEYSESQILPVIYPSTDMMPFKFKFPQITSGRPVLQKPEILFFSTNSNPLSAKIVYDDTLVKHADGHLTGFITNTGDGTLSNINVYAVVYDKNGKILDTAQSTTTIPQIKEGEMAKFVMYPDPLTALQVGYYSCFIPGTDNFIQISTQWKGKTFHFSVLSIVYFSNQKFDKDSNSISFDAANPWQMPFYANFMFPAKSSTGDFTVMVDGKKVNSLTSQDSETGNWHVAFNVDYGQHKVIISGFDENYVPNTDEYFFLTPKSALTAWAGYSTFTVSDSKLLGVLGIGGEFVPPWVKNSVKFMIFNGLPPDEIVNEIKYLKQDGIVK